jgi:DNA mismatch repair protein MutL
VKDAARDTGTTIAVRDLFFNMPARRKFMRSEATENYHLTSIVTHYALGHPEIAFAMTNNGRDVIRVSPAKDLRERAFQIFGAGMLDSLLPVDGGREYVARITGFVSAPRERRTTRDGQYFFVNKRFVRDKTIAGGLLEGYRSVLPHGVYPVAFLFLDIPLEEIDVNVHPAKTEIRFRRGEAVKEVIADAVRTTLARAGITGDPAPASFSEGPARTLGVEPADGLTTAASAEEGTIAFRRETIVTESLQPPLIEEAAAAIATLRTEFASRETVVPVVQPLAPNDEPVIERNWAVPELPPLNSAAKLAKRAEPENLSTAKIKPLGQMHESFIIAVDDEGLLLIDQHVAHERILFDKYRKSESDRSTESQNLLLPETMDLSPAQAEAYQLIEHDLEALGFGVMRLSGRTIAIKSIPTDLPASEARNLFAELLDTIELDKKGSAKRTMREHIAASLACKAAVKINMKLTTEKMQWLIDRLLLTSSPTTCPHGRPVILRLSTKDIERGFHRT